MYSRFRKLFLLCLYAQFFALTTASAIVCMTMGLPQIGSITYADNAITSPARSSIAYMEQKQAAEMQYAMGEDERIKDRLAQKSKDIIDIVHKAVIHFKNNRLEIACRDFADSLEWRKGEIFVYVLNKKGDILCYGDDVNVIWKNISISKNHNTKPVLEMIERVAKKGDWIDYQWNNGTQFAYAKEVVKNNATYYILAGFYPESKEYDTLQMVGSAANLFYDKGIDELIKEANNMFGQFVKSDMVLLIYNEKGDLITDPENTGFLGQSLLKITHESSPAILERAQAITSGKISSGWITYRWKNALLRTFLKRVVDPKTKKSYVITAGYYPDINRKNMVDFVHKAIEHVKTVGAKEAFTNFNNAVGAYIDGPLTIFVYDYEGKNLADGANPSFVGKNLLDRKDVDGTQITKKMIEYAQKYGKGSFTFFDRNQYKERYFEAIEVPDGKFIIGSGYFPSSTVQSVESLVMKGASYLKKQSANKVFGEFNNPNGEYFRGNLYLFVYTVTGTALVNGLNRELIWKNFEQLKDVQGKSIIEDLIALAKSGGGWAQYATRNALRRIYVQLVIKHDPLTQQEQQFIIGSGYYV